MVEPPLNPDTRPLNPDTRRMEQRIRAHDWSKTPLGPIDRWPPSLRTVVSILVSSRYAMWMAWGPELTFLCNDAYAPTLGLKEPWALGARADQVWAEIWPDIGPRIETVLRTGAATYDEGLLLFLQRSGFAEETYHTFSYSPLSNDEGAISGMLCVVTEETERVIGERRVETLRDVASALAETSTEEEVFNALEWQLGRNPKDLPFTLTYLFDENNAAALASSTGIKLGDALAPARIEAGEAAPWPAAHVLELPARNIVVDVSELRIGFPLAGAGNRQLESAVVVPIKRQGQERPAGFLVAGISPFRSYDVAYEGFIRLLAGQIAAAVGNARAYAAERRRAEELAELDRAKTAFFSNVSHEFRTPLTLMLGPLEELLEKPASELPASSADLAAVVHRNALRLLKLVNSLLDFARIEAGRANAIFEAVDFCQVTADLASAFRPAVERAGLRLDVDCPPLPEPVYIDREMWEKVILNLLSNALKFTFHGRIVISVRLVEGNVETVVSDTGAGIPESELPRIFTRFHRVRGAVGRTHEGTGIGLALVQEIVRQHGGSIRVESQLGQGSAFTLSIPRGKAHLPADRIGAARSTVSTAVEPKAWVEEALHWIPGRNDSARPPGEHDVRVYLAEDNADMREYLRRLLQSRYNVSVFPDGAAALAAVREHPPDLLLTDVMMPRMDGFELLKAIRGDEALSAVRVILLSARAGEESKVEGLEAGADDYLVKPFTRTEVLARVRAHVEMSRSRKLAEQRLRDAQKLESVGLLAGGVAHDFNNLLVGVLGNASLLLDCFPPDQPEYAMTEGIIQAAQAAANLTKQLLAYAGKGQVAMRRVDLSELVRDTRNLLDSTIPKEVAIDLRLASGVDIEADPTQIQQLIMNLAINGAEAIGDHRRGRIAIETVTLDGHAILRVTDTGSGMTPDVAARIYEPFFTTKFTGRGLGLAAVHGIVRSHRGAIDLETAPGRGSTFRISFPALPANGETNGAPSPERADLSGNQSVLVVDDEPIVRKLARTALEQRGYSVATVANGEEAMALLEQDPARFDAILLDWAMPVKNGQETLAAVRGLRPNLVVVLSSGYNESEAARHFPSVDAFIQKPYTVAQLAAVMKDALAGLSAHES